MFQLDIEYIHHRPTMMANSLGKILKSKHTCASMNVHTADLVETQTYTETCLGSRGGHTMLLQLLYLVYYACCVLWGDKSSSPGTGTGTAAALRLCMA